MFIKGKYLLKRNFRDEKKNRSYCVHYVLLNADTSPSIARVRDFREDVPSINANTLVRVNSNLVIDADGFKHVFYTDLEVLKDE